MKQCVIAMIMCSWVGAASADQSLVIVTERDPGVVEQFAAQEMQSYLEKVCGRKFPIQTERTEGATNLIITSAKEGDDLGSEGFVLRTEGSDLVLAGGGPRGKLYGVYEFIETHLGVRWFGSDASDETIPKRSVEDIVAIIKKGINGKQVPSFPFREISSDLGGPDSIPTLGKLRFNAVHVGYGLGSEKWKETVLPELRKRGIDLVMGSHDTYHRFLSPKEYFVDHPDWSILHKDKRVGMDTLSGGATFCTTNHDALATFLQNLAAYVKKVPEAKYLYPWPSDAGRWCECENCRKQSVGDRLLALDIAIAEAVKKVRPDMIVIHFAYGSHMEVPEHLRPPKEMAVSFSAWGRDFAFALDEEGTREEFRKALIGWGKICEECGNPMYIHSKHARLFGIGFVLMPLSVTQRDIRYLKGLGVDGFDFHRGNYAWWTKGLNDSVVAKLAWNCDANVDATTDDYFRAYWGPAHKEAKEIFQSVEKALPHRGYWWTSKNPNLFHSKIEITMSPIARPDKKFSKEFLDEVEKYNDNSVAVLGSSLETIRRLRAENQDPILAKRVEKLEKTFEYVHLQREGIKLFLDLHKFQATISASAEENLRNLREKEAILDKLEALEKRIEAMCTKENRQAGVLWDNGQSRLDMVKEWRADIDKCKAQFEADQKVEKDIIWQIGKFYATFQGDMGGGAGQPAHVKYRIPDDWKLGRDASDFPQRHNEPSKTSSCRYDILFQADPGKYLLTVAHGTSAKPETVHVLLDGKEIGQYTTQKEERSARADFSIEITNAGEHAITLTEPDESGGGYELDAIRLIRKPGG